MDDTGKGDIPMDSPMEDTIPELTGSRRPGNLWTPQAREDMFRRREAGETWETICLDYPKRSRHAMQQQYSMMKKQRALANGTWTSNRRGRKRKNPSPEKWPSLARRQQSRDTPDDELTEDDDFDDLSSDEQQDILDEVEKFKNNFLDERPSTLHPLPRAITDPIAKTSRSKIVTFPNLPSTTGLTAATTNGSNPTISIDRVPDHPDLVGSAYPPKRRKTSPALTTKVETPTPSVPASAIPPETYLPPEVAFDKTELSELINRGTERARNLASLYEAERTAQRKIFEASTARFSRRTHDAQERLRYALHEHADTLKNREREHTENMKNQAREHSEKQQIMRRELDEEQRLKEDIQIKNIDSLRRQNDELKRQIESLQRIQQEQKEQQEYYEHELASLRMQSRPPELSGATTPAVPNGTNVPEPTREPSGQDSIIEKLQQQVQHYQFLLSKIDGGTISSWKSRETEGRQALDKAMADFASLSLSITKLFNEHEDMSNKQVIKTISSLKLENDSTQESMRQAGQSLDVARGSREALVKELDEVLPYNKSSTPNPEDSTRP